MNRAFSILEIRSVDDEQRIIEGIATSPTTDRMGDIVESEGAIFNLPIPLLWQHKSDSPIGHVISATVTEKGILIRAKIEREDEPGELKNLLDRAWQSIKKKLVRGLSIGFNPLEWSDIKGSYGQRFTSWEWLELSAVTIPANQQATIQSVKSFDLAASGEPVGLPPKLSGTVKLITTTRDNMTITEQIRQFEATRQAKAARMEELMKVSGENGETLDAAQETEYDGLRDDVVAVDKHLVRLREQETLNITRAVPVNGNGTQAATESRSPTLVVKAPEKLEPGIEFARYAMCVFAANGNPEKALQLMQDHYPQQVRPIQFLKAASRHGMKLHKYTEGLYQTKANVVAGTTTGETWAEPLVAYNTFAGDFVEYLRPRTILGQFGQNGVPDLRRIPFNVHIKGRTSGGTSYWVGEGKPKPVTKFDFIDAYHGFYKIAAITVLTEELVRFSDPSAERLVREALTESNIERSDIDFIDPDKAVSAGVSPASVTNGVAAIGSGGTDADAVRADIQALWAAGIAANLPLTSAVYITTPAIAMALGLMVNALGQSEFSGMTMRGGGLLGVPVLVSNYVPEGLFILAFASEIYLSDDGAVSVDVSNQASIQMVDNPTNDSVTPTATSMVSMFQTDSVALRSHRYINWSKRRATAVALLDGVGWGGAPLTSP